MATEYFPPVDNNSGTCQTAASSNSNYLVHSLCVEKVGYNNDVFSIKVSFLTNFFDNDPLVRPLMDVVKNAKSPGTKYLTEFIREKRCLADDPSVDIDMAKQAKIESDKKKKDLPSFITNTLCEHGKSRKDIVCFLPFIGFDIDHISTEQVKKIMEILANDPHVPLASPSCSGLGIHFMVLMDANGWINENWDGKDLSRYEFVWNQVHEYVKGIIAVPIDEKCKNPEHIFGINYDERLMYKESCEPLHIDVSTFTPRQISNEITSIHQASGIIHHATLSQVCNVITQKLEEDGCNFVTNNRNNYVTRFAYMCNDYGVDQSEVGSYCISNFTESNFTEREILATINSAYKKVADHGKFCAPCADEQAYQKMYNKDNSLIINSTIQNEQNCSNAQIAQNEQELNNDIYFHQTFSDKINAHDWPTYFCPVLNSMDDAESRDKMILGTLVTNSSMLPNYYGLYSKKIVYSPLYIIMYGPSASRKGEIGACQNIVKPLNDEIISEYKQKMADYRELHGVWESKGSKNKDRGPEPIEPEYRSLIIPANSSASATYMALNENDGRGIIFETEAAALTQSLLSDYGNYSPGLLAAFHHEPIKMNRVKDKIHFELNNPCLAVCMTCTYGQLPKLFPTFEDGLGNRFLYYGLNRKLEWINPFQKVEKSLDEIYEDLGKESLEIYHLLMNLDGRQIQFLLSETQQQQFNNFFSSLLLEQFAILGDGITSFIFRLGISTFRIAMILTMLRRYSEWDRSEPFFKEGEQAIICGDKDFNIALTIMNTLVNHTAVIYANLAKEDEQLNQKQLSGLTATESSLFKALPDEFNTDDIRKESDNLHIAYDTARRYIGKYCNVCHIAERIKNGQYKKTLNKNLKSSQE